MGRADHVIPVTVEPSWFELVLYKVVAGLFGLGVPMRLFAGPSGRNGDGGFATTSVADKQLPPTPFMACVNRARRHYRGGRLCPGSYPLELDDNPLHLVERNFIGTPVIELGRAGR